MSDRINWNGVANTINRLKDLNEPSYYEKTDYDAHIKNIQDKEEAEFDQLEDKFGKLYSAYGKNKTDLENTWSNLDTIDEGLAKIYRNREDESDASNFYKIIEQNDISKINHLEGLNSDIATMVDKDINERARASDILDNAAFGSSLFKKEKNTGGYYIDEAGDKVYSWDLDKIGGVSEVELEKALDGTIKMMKNEADEAGHTFSEDGIREGFWAGFNKTKRLDQELNMIDKVHKMVENGQATTDPIFEATIKASKKYEQRKMDKHYDKLSYIDGLDDQVDIYMQNGDAIRDWDNSEGAGPAEGTEWENPHWQFVPKANGPQTEEVEGRKIKGTWEKTELRKKMNTSNTDVYIDALKMGYGHYFADIAPTNFKSNFNIYTQGKGGQQDIKELSLSDAGLSEDFYKSFRKDLRVPVWQDMAMSVDTSGDGVKDSKSMIQAHTAWFEGDEGKKWAMEFKKQFEMIVNFVETIGTGDESVNEQDAQDFNESMDVFSKAYPEHFQDKVKLRVNIMTNKLGQRFYYLHDDNAIN